jgi:hypothetical protein
LGAKYDNVLHEQTAHVVLLIFSWDKRRLFHIKKENVKNDFTSPRFSIMHALLAREGKCHYFMSAGHCSALLSALIKLQVITTLEDYVVAYDIKKRIFYICYHRENKKFTEKFTGQYLVDKFATFRSRAIDVVVAELKTKKGAKFSQHDFTRAPSDVRMNTETMRDEIVDLLQRTPLSKIVYVQSSVPLRDIAVVD